MPTISAIMIHVANISDGLDWYQRAFPDAQRVRIEKPSFELLKLGDLQLEIVPADGKVAAGAAGSVVYWQAPDFEAALAHFLSVGATLYRGPMVIEDEMIMCQVRDPWGNCIGLRGNFHKEK